MDIWEPSYVKLLHSGELARRAAEAYAHLSECDVCPWVCKVNRRAGERGFCRVGELAGVASYGPHLGEESVLRGWRGSGTIFFTGCNLKCKFCQNYEISQLDEGDPVEPKRLAAIMLELQEMGCHNINFVSPSHVVPQILMAVLIAAQAGLRLPLVYNSGGYDSLTMLRILDGVIDIYMPDMKYADAQIARRYSGVANYPQVNQAAVREMHRQVGDLVVDENGLARRGLLVRHLILPENLAGTERIIEFLAREISPHTYLNLMDQYRPAYKACEYPELSRRITRAEWEQAVAWARKAGLYRLDGL
ncbi:MAG: radical SAM protein [Ardenticatenia bacterium]|nr:MAG: radical SAM protein [Ardenticatenia bacterium]